MRFALPSSSLNARAAVERLREATARALPYLLLVLAMSGYVLIAVSQGWLAG